MLSLYSQNQLHFKEHMSHFGERERVIFTPHSNMAGNVTSNNNVVQHKLKSQCVKHYKANKDAISL